MAPILRTLCVWLPIATLPLLLLSVSHIHAVHLALGNRKRFRWYAFMAHSGDRTRYPLVAAATAGRLG